jgi:hypothetical protein
MEKNSKAYKILDRIAAHVACGLLFFGLVFAGHAFGALRAAHIPVWPVVEDSLLLPIVMAIWVPSALRRFRTDLSAKATEANQTLPRTL